jgi:hypothetical protein
MPKPPAQFPSSARSSGIASEFDEIRDLLRGKSAEVYPEVLQAASEGAQAQPPRRPDLIDAALAILEGCELKRPPERR